MAVTAAQQRELAKLARAANRRLERATPGQRAYLESRIERYHVRERESGAIVFRQGKATSEAEYKARMRELNRFMGYEKDPATGEPLVKTSTRRGWEAMKKAQVEAAGKTLRKQSGYNITDEELAAILQEIEEGHRSAEFYSALANVEIAKGEANRAYRDALADKIEAGIKEGLSLSEATEAAEKSIKLTSFWSASASEIAEAINARRTDQERTRQLLLLRRER